MLKHDPDTDIITVSLRDIEDPNRRTAVEHVLVGTSFWSTELLETLALTTLSHDNRDILQALKSLETT